ncbi:hypothetical protein E8E12_004111 [Didymella heteroderae]|uniref:Uncharacterized protein n=1 Tax=Didymella heteroderae TaxID=1769908 RepID=A0A9P5C2H4_9PLEO|nr:hypothetical protein E8E12_004111 [Didymella heteroderae]
MATQYAPVDKNVDTAYAPQQPPMSYAPQGQVPTDEAYKSTNPNMDWNAQIAETDGEVKHERSCDPFAGCCTIPELPSCSL